MTSGWLIKEKIYEGYWWKESIRCEHEKKKGGEGIDEKEQICKI